MALSGEKIEAGAGHASPEADAVAELLAAHLNGDAGQVSVATARFASAHADRMSKKPSSDPFFDESRMSAVIEEVVAGWPDSPSKAKTLSPGLGGDVAATSPDDRAVLVEVKAQLTIPCVKQIQAADWAREATDTLGWLLENDPALGAALSPDVRRIVADSYQPDSKWGLSSLWAADLAGLPNRGYRLRHGVKTPGDLMDYLATKYVLLICLERARLFRMADIPAVVTALSSDAVSYVIRRNKASDATIWTRGDGVEPRQRGIHFTYYLGQNSRPVGGHHVHAALLADAEPVVAIPLNECLRCPA